MSRELVIGLTIAVYIIFMAVVGLISRKGAKSITDFTVGGRNAGAWVSALSYGTAYFSAVMFIGYAGKTGWAYGIWGVLVGIGNAVFGSLLAWLLLANRTREVTRKLKIKSMPQFFEKRYGSKKMKNFCVAIIFIFLLPYSASVYSGLTSVCSVLLGVPEQICMIIIAVVAALIVTLGGYIATLKADFVQGIVMFFGIIILIISVIRCENVGGISGLFKNMNKISSDLGLGTKQYVGLFATLLMTSFGTLGLPQMIHKYYGIKDKHEVKRGTIISTVFALLVAGGGYFIGSLSHFFYSDLSQLPQGAGNADYIVPNMLLQAGLPNILLGVVLVLLIAASVSTLSSITITASSTLTMDMITPHSKKMNPEKAAWVTKGICVLFIALSYVIANTKTPILDMMSYSWGVISGSFLAPYMLALYRRKMNKASAWAGILSGFVVAMPPVLCKLFFNGASLGSFGRIMDMGPHFAVAAMVVSFAVCLVVSAVTKPDANDCAEKFYAKEAEAC